jgi:hypothetical protein
MEEHAETTPIFDCHGCRRRRHRDSRTGDRAVITDFEMAIDGKLAEIARYVVRHL